MATNPGPAETDWIVELSGDTTSAASGSRRVRASYVSYATAHDGLVELKDSNHKVVFTAPLTRVSCVRRADHRKPAAGPCLPAGAREIDPAEEAEYLARDLAPEPPA